MTDKIEEYTLQIGDCDELIMWWKKSGLPINKGGIDFFLQLKSIEWISSTNGEFGDTFFLAHQQHGLKGKKLTTTWCQGTTEYEAILSWFIKKVRERKLEELGI